MTPATLRALVNDNAAGAWSARVGTELELVGPGQNPHHVIVRRPGERKTFGLPAHWIDAPEPERCPTCGRELEERRTS